MCILRNRKPVSLLKVGHSWEGNMNVYLKELSAGVIIEGRAQLGGQYECVS